ncbi:MAG: CoB--CoM heterodisulfide reductase iron-sulfur subunit A family protein [Theionarchaea archaeon]|nr:CoB--CoM heterodisulfide reductase iron-sulfur subunit A family protein [Theionarchaea archaeon]
MQKRDVLIIGAGIGGMQAALDVADKGFKVVLLDRSPSIGGSMVKLDKTFPTNDCSICTAAPKMVEIGRHPNIDLMTHAEIARVEGDVGSFRVTVWKRTGYIDPQKCTGCGDCVECCPVEVPNEFDSGLSKRKAIFLQFPQAVPSVYTIDIENCVGCGACSRQCDAQSIDFLERSREEEFEVSSIIVATGFQVLEPKTLKYGFGEYPNVITALQYERLLSASGPTLGEVVRPSDGKKPQKIGWIQCVGSRSPLYDRLYCSRVCCMYATKEAMITRDHHPDIDTTIFYMDLRAYGKGFEEYYNLAEDMGVTYIRSRPVEAYQKENGNIVVVYENTYTGEIEEEEFELLVLSTAIIPSQIQKLAAILDIELDENDFVKERDVVYAPFETSREGIYVAGCSQAPKDIPDSVAQACAAACKALIDVRKKERSEKAEHAEERPLEEQPRVGVIICHCGKNIAGFLDVEKATEYATELPNVVYSEHEAFACSEDAQVRIKKAVEEQGLNRLVVAACSPRTHAFLFQQTLAEVGLNKYLFEMANIRNHCSWVHSSDWDKATEKAKDLVRSAVKKVQLQEPLHEMEVEVARRALVIGGGISGISAALNLARLGIYVYLVEKEGALGGNLRNVNVLFPTDIEAKKVLRPLLKKVKEEQNVKVFTNTTLKEISGYIGNYEGVLSVKGKDRTVQFGTVIVATGFSEVEPKGLYGYGENPNIVTELQVEKMLQSKEVPEYTNVVFIGCVGSRCEERAYCCRVGCGNAVKNAKILKERNPKAKVFVLYRDVRTFGKKEEEYYEDVQKKGVIFLRYTEDKEPRVTFNDGKMTVTVYDNFLKEDIELPADLVVLNAALEGDSTAEQLKALLKIPLGDGRYFMEAHAKIRPLDFPTDGVYLCGAAHSPKGIADSIAQAVGAASRAAVPMMKGWVTIEPIISSVDEEVCSGCGICIQVCPYQAIEKDENGKSRVIQALCKGCGACGATCPQSAITMRGYTDAQLDTMVDTLLEVES